MLPENIRVTGKDPQHKYLSCSALYFYSRYSTYTDPMLYVIHASTKCFFGILDTFDVTVVLVYIPYVYYTFFQVRIL